ncbi:MAG: hypothetical protein CFH34_01728 [Alphaproteobacteria bacterium MarineAlpha9_Bin4]|nr:hypothetical protein [Pelagibacterales bacterium]PPR24672.1 MAG: hypothetical protein CFH34_01728 [Alphaproteobacteria bacterium MarineAlpha9_Bin4]|tara:strand:- start:1699 stop:2085 length:387 start_codon:yes stop_codon:yes gene_type:complete
MKKYWISIDTLDFEITLRNTETAKKITQNLPLKGECQKWGKEFYFYTHLKIPLEETAKQVISFGEIAYWPAGDAIAIGYGKTPLSVRNEIRLADKCNIWAETKFDLNKLEGLLNPKIIMINNRQHNEN